MDISTRPPVLQFMAAHAAACVPLAYSILQDKKEVLKMVCCSVIAMATECYFHPISRESFTPPLLGLGAAAIVQKFVFRESDSAQFWKFAYINMGARLLIGATLIAGGMALYAGAGNVLATATGLCVGTTPATWVVSSIARKIFSQEEPKTS